MESKGRIGLIVPHILYNPDAALVDIIHRQAMQYGYDTVVLTGVINYVDEMLEDTYAKGQTNLYDLISCGKFDGFIFEAGIFCSERQRKRIIELLGKQSAPAVVIGYDQPNFPNITAEESSLLYQTTKHLAQLHGCRRIICIGGYKGHPQSEERIQGFRKAMEEAGLAYSEEDIIYGDYWRTVPHQVALDIAEGRLEKPDGIVCGSDIMAVELCRTLMANGIRVPEDICVTGCDGNMVSQTEAVTITTVSSQESRLGMAAARRLLSLMGEEVPDEELSPALVIGESCGCAELGRIVRSRELSDIRSYAGSLLEKLEARRTSSTGEILRRMSEASTLDDVMGTVIGCCYMIPNNLRGEVCLCSDWCKDLDHPSVYRRGGFSEKMILGTEVWEGGFFNKHIEFPVGELLPSLSEKHSPRLIVLSSLHYKGQIFGYIALTYPKAADILMDEYFMQWCDAVSSGLNTVQNKLYKAYVNARIEALSEFAPVLGIYNRRGLISRLTGLLSDSSDTVYGLCLLTYLKQERQHDTVPPINAIVHAMRLSEKDLLLASLDEQTIAFLAPEKELSGSPQALSAQIAKQVGQVYRTALNIKEEQIVIVRSSVTYEDIFSIEELLRSMESELKGKALSLRSGAFSYQERLQALRETIFREPQRDWNMDEITRSLGVSKSHFQRIYKELFGTTCKEDIIQSRLSRAKWLLENTQLLIADVAEQCGYSNTSHFVRQFTARIGEPPSAYRKQK
ncbi:MAG TPA: AraC family transcriptional regulator [Ruminococcus sp.]|nr:AraC family transcriptional regulator [Ruminococcus sp.]